MVLESLLSIRSIRERPYLISIPTILGTLLAVLITNYLSQTGLFLVFLIVLVLLPITITNLKQEEKKKEYDHFWEYLYSLNFLIRHSNIIIYYFSIIVSIAITIAFLYLVLPSNTYCNIFSDQNLEIYKITEKYPEECKPFIYNYNPPTGHLIDKEQFLLILFNNLLVAIIMFAFSLFYSSGAIFLISWNASVLGVAVGQGVRQLCSFYALPSTLGIPLIPPILLSYALHGIPEFLGYILVGIAGALLSIAITRHKENKKHKYFVIKDSLLLFSLGISFIIIGAILEVL